MQLFKSFISEFDGANFHIISDILEAKIKQNNFAILAQKH